MTSIPRAFIITAVAIARSDGLSMKNTRNGRSGVRGVLGDFLFDDDFRMADFSTRIR
jgi:hypothetical protein